MQVRHALGTFGVMVDRRPNRDIIEQMSLIGLGRVKTHAI